MKIEVVNLETLEVVRSVDCGNKTQRDVDRVERGMLINMDRDRFFTRQVDAEGDCKNG